ncbi:MAG: hypothetical protein R8M70_01355 [Alphaproteobacteria bacterium]|nr:hypothetical protein [Alphaproteobacteria bacterium]
MKLVLSAFVILTSLAPAFGVAQTRMTTTGRNKPVVANKVTTSPRAVAPKNQIVGLAYKTESIVATDTDDVTVTKDNRDKEKRACISNNIGVGNTFVWASRYSNTANYSSMIEDVEEPDNNTCFVKVELKSDDAKISVADFPTKYYEMGHNIACGEWVDYDMLKERILDAKKSARTWATVGGAVGGAAIGVGAMELFGNRWIGGAVEGQKQFEKDSIKLLRSQLAVLKAENEQDYKNFVESLGDLKCACQEYEKESGKDPLQQCKNYKYAFELSELKNCKD